MVKLQRYESSGGSITHSEIAANAIPVIDCCWIIWLCAIYGRFGAEKLSAFKCHGSLLIAARTETSREPVLNATNRCVECVAITTNASTCTLIGICLFVCLPASTCAMPLKSSNREKRKHCSKKKDSKFTAKAKWFFYEISKRVFFCSPSRFSSTSSSSLVRYSKANINIDNHFLWSMCDVMKTLTNDLKRFSRISLKFQTLLLHTREYRKQLEESYRKPIYERKTKSCLKTLVSLSTFLFRIDYPKSVPSESTISFCGTKIWGFSCGASEMFLVKIVQRDFVIGNRPR